jgi:hypothetical protein
MSIILDVEFAFSQGVPELDRPISAPAHDLPVISAEADAKNVRFVPNKATCSLTGVQVPETESVIP